MWQHRNFVCLQRVHCIHAYLKSVIVFKRLKTTFSPKSILKTFVTINFQQKKNISIFQFIQLFLCLNQKRMPCNTPPPPNMETIDDPESDSDIIEEFDIPEDESILTFSEHQGSVFCCNFNSNASLAVSGGEDDKAFVWDANSGDTKFECADHKDSVIFAEFSPDDSFVATSDMSGIIQVWEANTGAKVWNFDVAEITLMKWHQKENVLFAGTNDGCLWKWSIPDGETGFSQVSDIPVSCGKLQPDGGHFVIGYKDGSMKFFETNNLTLVKSVTGDTHTENIISVDCYKDNILVATGSEDGTCKLVKSTTGKVLWTANCSTLEDDNSSSFSVESVAFCNSHPIVATGTNGGSLAFWDVGSSAKRSSTQITEDAIVKMEFARNSPLLYLVTSGSLILLFDSRTTQVERKWDGHAGGILDFYISRDETKLLSCGDDSYCKIFNIG